MKKILLLSTTALSILLTSGCDRQSPEVAKQLAELERQASEAVGRQQELEQQIEDQKLAAERDAIERERMQIEQDRIDLEREQGEIAEAEAEKLNRRETDLAQREGDLERLQATLEEQQAELSQQTEELSEKDRELAGREAIAFTEDEVQSAPVADYGTFHDSLSPYGSWFETDDYGYVWQPAVIRDTTWRPYTRGRWACTDRGWTWISDEPFGWATYHYGRWSLLRGRGWVWVPGSEWAPSWVSWRYCDSYVGWAPLPPETLAYRGSRWGSTVDVTFGIGAGWFNFVQLGNFCRPVRYHCLPYTNNHLYYDRCANITNIYVQNNRVICGGPRYRDLCDRIGRPVPFYRLDVDHHGSYGRDSLGMRSRIQGNRLRVAAPSMDVAWNDGLRPRRVQGRIDNLTVDRQQALRPEVSDRFRQSREQGRSDAKQSIAQLGGSRQFRQRRIQQLEANRRPTSTASRNMQGSGDVARQSNRGTDTRIAQNRSAQTTLTGQSQRQPENSRTQANKIHVPATEPGNAKPAQLQTQIRKTPAPSVGPARQSTMNQRPSSQTGPQPKVQPNIARVDKSANPLPKGVTTVVDARQQQAALSKLSGQRQAEPSRTQPSEPRIHPPKPSSSGKSAGNVIAPKKQPALAGSSLKVSPPAKLQGSSRISPPVQSNAQRQQQVAPQQVRKPQAAQTIREKPANDARQAQIRQQQFDNTRKQQAPVQRQQAQVRPPQPQYTPRPQAQPAPRQQPQRTQRSEAQAPPRQQSVQRSQPQPQYRQQQSRQQPSQSNQRGQSSQQGQSSQRGQRGR